MQELLRALWTGWTHHAHAFTSLAHKPPLWQALALHALLCVLLVISFTLVDRMPGKRKTSDILSATSEIAGGVLVIMALFLFLTLAMEGVTQLLGATPHFERLFCVISVSAVPIYLAWISYPLCNLHWGANRIWFLFSSVMLLWMARLLIAGLHFACSLAWWKAYTVALPLSALLLAAFFLVTREPPDSFFAAYRWARARGQRVVVFTPRGKNPEEVAEIVRGCDATLEQVTLYLEVKPLDFKVSVFLCADKEHHRKLTGVKDALCDGYAYGDSISLVYNTWEALRSSVAHEFCHVMLTQRICKQKLSGLLNEGLAEYTTQQVMPDTNRQPAISIPMPLTVLARPRVFFAWICLKESEHPSWNYYAQAHSFARYLIERDGLARYKQLCVAAADTAVNDEGERFASAIHKVYAISAKEMERNWRAACERKETRRDPWQEEDRFTAKARDAIHAAHEEASGLGHETASTEHLLLGLLRDKENLACQLLSRAGISARDICERLLRQPLQEAKSEEGNQRWSADSWRALEFAHQEARHLNHDTIGTEHLLLGLIRAQESSAGRTLAQLGADLTTMRRLAATLHEQ